MNVAAAMPSLDPVSIAKWLAVAYVIPVALLVVISAAWSANVFIFAAALVGLAWQVGPVALTAWLARHCSTAGAWAFLALQLGIFAFAGWIWYLLLVVDPDPQAPIALFIFVPLYEYAAVGAFAILASFVGWLAFREHA